MTGHGKTLFLQEPRSGAMTYCRLRGYFPRKEAEDQSLIEEIAASGCTHLSRLPRVRVGPLHSRQHESSDVVPPVMTDDGVATDRLPLFPD